MGSLSEYRGATRSILWRGGSAHLRVCGDSRPAPDPHAHFAVQLTIGWGGEIPLRKGWRDSGRVAPGWLIGSDRRHWMQACGVGVSVFFDPLSTTGRRAAAWLNGADALALTAPECEFTRRELEDCWACGWLSRDVCAAADRIVDRFAPALSAVDPMDARVRTVIDELMRTSGENVSLAELAARVRLSESRLAHLFSRDVGLPMRQYRLSLRMEQAVVQIAQGSSLTEAAHMAGFSDSAHFCRVCRRMYGSAPSNLPDFAGEMSSLRPASKAGPPIGTQLPEWPEQPTVNLKTL